MKNWLFILKSELRGEVELLHEPMNWRDRETRLVRDMKYYGIAREIISPIRFVKDGMAYIKDVFNSHGHNAKVQLDVFEYDFQKREYENYFSGELIMKSVEFNESDIQVMATPTTIQELIKNRRDTKVNLLNAFSLNYDMVFAPALRSAMIHSRLIQRRLSAIWNTTKAVSLPAGRLLQIGYDELETNELKGWISERVTIGSTEVFPMYKAEEAGEHVLDIYFACGSNSGNGDEIQFYYAINDTAEAVAVSTSYQFITDGVFSYSFFNVTLNTSIHMNVGDTLFIWGVSGRSHTATLHLDGFNRPTTLAPDRFKITAKTYTEPKPVQGLLAFEAMEQALKVVTGERAPLSSTILGRTDLGYGSDGEAALNLITTGAAISQKESSYETSLADLFSSLQAIYNIGMATQKEGLSTKVVVEPMEYYFRKRLGFKIKGVSNLRKRVAEQVLHDQVNAGYRDHESNMPGNSQDPNVGVKYVIKANFINNALDAESLLIGSSYVIEEKRREQNEGDAKKRYDDNMFIISLVRDGQGFKSRTVEGFQDVQGVEEPESMHNIDLHPARNLRRWGNYLNTGFYKQSGIVGFSSSGSRSTLRTTKTGAILEIGERRAFSNEEMERPLFFPELYEFECKLTAADDKELMKRMYEVIEVETDQGTVFGYLLERTRTERNQASFTLLRANYNG